MKKIEDKEYIFHIIFKYIEYYTPYEYQEGYCMFILQEKWRGMVKNWQRKLGGYIVTPVLCHINAFFTYFLYIWSYYILYVNQVGYFMFILQKNWRETVENSWNGTVSTIVTLIILWHDVTGYSCYQELFNSNNMPSCYLSEFDG